MIISADRGVSVTDARDISMDHVKILTPARPLYSLKAVNHFTINHGYLPNGTGVFLREDSTCNNVQVTGTDFGKNKEAIELEGRLDGR